MQSHDAQNPYEPDPKKHLGALRNPQELYIGLRKPVKYKGALRNHKKPKVAL